MSDYLKDILKSGKTILADTKAPRKAVAETKKQDKKAIAPLGTPAETDPHRAFVKRTIQELPKKSILIDDFKKFIDAAEAAL